MKRILYSLIIILFSCSCKNNNNLNNPIGVSNYILTCLKSSDTTNLKLIISNPVTDTLILDSINSNMSIQEYNDTSNKRNYEEIYNDNKKYVMNHFFSTGGLKDRVSESTEFFLNNNIDISKVDFLRFKLHNESLNLSRKTYFVYYKTKDSTSFVILLTDPYFKNDTLKISSFQLLTEEMCNEYFYLKIDFQDKENGFTFINPNVDTYSGGSQWRYNNTKPNEFINFYIPLRNDSKYDFNKIKIHISFTNPKDPNEVYFSKSIVKEVDLKKGDHILVDINEICNTNVGFNVTSNKNFIVHTYIEDFYPFPYSKEFDIKN